MGISQAEKGRLITRILSTARAPTRGGSQLQQRAKGRDRGLRAGRRKTLPKGDLRLKLGYSKLGLSARAL